jgi:hypothetical protein
MFGSDSLSRLNLRLRFRDSARLRRRRADRRLQVAPRVLRLEERCMLSVVPNQFPPDQVAAAVPVSNIIWNGGPPLDTVNGVSGVPSPSLDGPNGGAMKTITLTNNSPTMIYPFIRDTNTAVDPNAKNPPSGPNPNKYYDPQDLHGPDGLDFRDYIGYQSSTGTFMGLPSGASITFQVPLVFWAAATFYIATNPANLTSNVDVYNYRSSAKISIAGTTPVGTTPENTTTWVTKASNYPAGDNPVVVFYFVGAKTPGVNDAAPAQLIEWNFRDPYLMTTETRTRFILGDPNETKVLMNYDVSYVNKLSVPVGIEASSVPITVGKQLDTTNPPKYYGYQDYGWNPTDRDAQSFNRVLQEFVNDKGKNKRLGDYFGGKGWPEYYEAGLPDIVIPSGANIFAQSPLVDARSPYGNNNYYLIGSTSNGAGPIRIASLGATYAKGDTIHFAPDYKSQLQSLKDDYIDKKKTVVIQYASENDYPVGTKVTGVSPADLTITLDKTHSDRVNGGVYDFGSPVDDYAVTAITKLWYSWANYYVTNVFTDYRSEVTASAVYEPPTDIGLPQNEIILSSKPAKPLLVGMTVKGDKGGIRTGTTILGITNSKGQPIERADNEGDKIRLSLLPISGQIPPSQNYTFGKPTEIPSTGEAKPYKLTFDTKAAKDQAELFAGSVYAAMSAEAGVPNPPATKLPKSADIVSRVIQFYANLPTDPLPGGTNLTGQVRDVVKSLLRGVWNFEKVSNQKKWYPDPATPTSNAKVDGKDAKFGIYNLDPYVWFVRSPQALGTWGYAFSVDDDVSNPSAPGPILAPDSTPGNPVYNHVPNNLQIAVGGIQGFGNQNAWFPTLRWGTIKTTATIEPVGGTGDYKDDFMVYLKGDLKPDDYLKLFYQIFPPGPGEVGASISAPGYLKPGTTAIFLGPNGDKVPQIVLSQKPEKTTHTPIPITITGPFET